MSAVQWFSGPPPAVGWWPASKTRGLDVFRWWDGEMWSLPAYKDFSREETERWSEAKAVIQDSIKWRHWSIEIDGTDGRGAHE